jgi:predicted esterase
VQNLDLKGSLNESLLSYRQFTGCVKIRKILKKLRLLFAALSLCASSLRAQQNPGAAHECQSLPAGVVIPSVMVSKQPEQSYALYLPSAYSQDKRWPIVYSFDPGARGSMPVELMKEAAERYGYIVVGSNNSRNGSWKIEAAAADAMVKDTHARLSIDDRRVYLAGFSGGARAAVQIAQICKCAAGVFLHGAGFHPVAFSSKEAPFVVFSAVGTYDFNYPELVHTDEELEKMKYAHFWRSFPGPHQWAPAEVMEEALAWFRTQAMKSGRENRDDSFVASQAIREAERARAVGQSGDLYAARREYRQAAQMLAGLAENTALLERADALEKSKAVREGARREKQELEDQEQLSGEISSEIASFRENQANRVELRNAVEQQLIALRSRTEHEKHEEKLRVEKRALAGLVVQAMETGMERMENKDISRARDYFELASAGDPDSMWVLDNLAIARAMDGDRKGALEALRRAKCLSKNPPKFVEWLREEPAFAKLRGTPDFGTLLQP